MNKKVSDLTPDEMYVLLQFLNEKINDVATFRLTSLYNNEYSASSYKGGLEITLTIKNRNCE